MLLAPFINAIEPIKTPRATRLELAELLHRLTRPWEHTQDVEADGLGKGTALSDSDLICGILSASELSKR